MGKKNAVNAPVIQDEGDMKLLSELERAFQKQKEFDVPRDSLRYVAEQFLKWYRDKTNHTPSTGKMVVARASARDGKKRLTEILSLLEMERVERPPLVVAPLPPVKRVGVTPPKPPPPPVKREVPVPAKPAPRSAPVVRPVAVPVVSPPPTVVSDSPDDDARLMLGMHYTEVLRLLEEIWKARDEPNAQAMLATFVRGFEQWASETGSCIQVPCQPYGPLYKALQDANHGKNLRRLFWAKWEPSGRLLVKMARRRRWLVALRRLLWATYRRYGTGNIPMPARRGFYRLLSVAYIIEGQNIPLPFPRGATPLKMLINLVRMMGSRIRLHFPQEGEDEFAPLLAGKETPRPR